MLVLHQRFGVLSSPTAPSPARNEDGRGGRRRPGTSTPPPATPPPRPPFTPTTYNNVNPKCRKCGSSQFSTKTSRSRANPNRQYVYCVECGDFTRWASPARSAEPPPSPQPYRRFPTTLIRDAVTVMIQVAKSAPGALLLFAKTGAASSAVPEASSTLFTLPPVSIASILYFGIWSFVAAEMVFFPAPGTCLSPFPSVCRVRLQNVAR